MDSDDMYWRHLREVVIELKPQGAVAARTDSPAPNVSADLRIISVVDGGGVASASGVVAIGRLAELATGLVGKLRENVIIKGEAIAIVTLRNRSCTSQGKVITDELTDKIQGELINTGWFDVKERIDLRAILEEKDLETAGIVTNEAVKKKLGSVKYIVIGGVTVSEPGRP